MSTPTRVETTLGDRVLSITTGKLARQAGGSVIVQYGDTVVLGTATMGKPLSEDATFMPLLVEYEEKFYAAGKIKGSRFIKREGRPTDEAIVTARLIDRSIRPLFPEDMINDVQVVTTVLSYDGHNDPDILAVIAASAALSISDVPWNGPLGAVRIGHINGALVLNTPFTDREKSPLDIVIAGTASQAVMIEVDGLEVSEDTILDGLALAQGYLKQITDMILDLQRQVGKEKKQPARMKVNKENLAFLMNKAKDIFPGKLHGATDKHAIGNAEKETAALIWASLSPTEKGTYTEKEVGDAVHEFHAIFQRDQIIEKGIRGDGRALNEIRPLTIETGLLPRTHGSGLFQRGGTQVLTTVTLGGPSDVQLIDTMEIEAKKRYIHYYNFPAYSVGEIKPNRGPGRREIGHGALAERAIIPVLPDKEAWPYTMVVVSEVLESHGSSSMASACGSTLALMDGGVPIKRPVAGIAMGLVTDDKGNYRILTDIAGIEDERGDMDLKIAGTEQGVTAVQMDIKLGGVTLPMLKDGFLQAKEARLHILAAMAAVIAQPRPDLSPYAPRIEVMRVPVEKIGDLIGPKGKHIQAIIEETGVDIDIEDDGLVSITSTDAAAMQKAKDWVKNMTRELKPGERFDGKVTRLMDFGAFVELMPGIEGMVHISQFRNERVENIRDVVNVGDVIPVVVTEIDSMGRINLSHKGALPGGTIDTPKRTFNRPSRKPGNHPRPPRR